MKLLTKNIKRIVALFLLLITISSTIFSNLGIVLAATGEYIARIYETGYQDNIGQNIFKIRVQGDDIPALKEGGFGQVAFCLNHHMDHPETLTTFNKDNDFSSTADFRNSARLAYLAYYRYSNKDGNASQSKTGRSDSVQYAFTATLIWQKLGQVPNSYSLGSDFDEFKSLIMDEFNKWDTLPSFDGSTQTLDLGQTKTLTDNNAVLKYYETFNYTKDGITFKHTKGSNDMTISASDSVSKETVSLLTGDAIKNKMGKYINDVSIQTNFVLTPLSNDSTHQRLIVSYGYNDPKYLAMNININLYGNLEIAKKDDKGNFVPNTKFKVSYNSDMSEPIGTYTTEENGKVSVLNLQPKMVYIQEIEVPEHLTLDNAIHSITIKPNETATYTATNNTKQGYIKVVKKDAESGKIVKKAGTVFDIYDSEEQKVQSITTNSEGVATSGPLDYRKLHCKRIKGSE